MNAASITFHQRWREELVATSDEGILVFELTIGRFHLYFPDEEQWQACVPEWAKGKWAIYHLACLTWCAENRIPMSVVPDAHVLTEEPLK